MFSAVVLPAPFGPIRLVTLPGSARSDTSLAARTPPKAMPIRSASKTASPGPPGPPGGGPGEGGRARLPRGGGPVFEKADHAVGREPQDQKEQRAEKEQPVLGESGEELRQQHHDRRAAERAGKRAGAADDDDEHEQDGLRERERRRRDETGQREEEGARHPGAERGNREGRGLDAHRVEADRYGGDHGVLHRAHRRAPTRSAQE